MEPAGEIFRGSGMQQWTPIQGLKEYGAVLGRKMGFAALGWLVLYFASQPLRQESGMINVLTLFAPMVGAIGGLVVGWYMAINAVEDSGFSGLPLWTLLVAASWVSMCVVEWIMHLILPRWNFGFGGWMVLMSGMLLSLATAVWYASSQE
jgi:hypothetical protein